jgi:LPXTG-motif cell wall-anchored protein
VLAARVQRQQLPTTGSSTPQRLQLAGVLLSAGGLLTLATRRRRSTIA